MRLLSVIFFYTILFLVTPSLGAPIRIECGTGLPCRVADAAAVMTASDSRSACPSCIPALNNYGSCGGQSVFWSRLENIAGGPAALAELERAVSNGGLIGSRLIVMEVLNPPKGQRQILLCTRTIRGMLEGVPTDCRVVAIKTDKGTLIKAEVPNSSGICLASSSMGADMATIKNTFSVQSNGVIDTIAGSMSKMMIDDLALQFEREDYKDGDGKVHLVWFSGIAPMRDSKILGGGEREIFNFSLWIRRTPVGYDISSDTKPMVCRTASGNAIEYHGLTDAQRQTYADSLDKAISLAISKTCKNFKAIDSKNLQCQ